MQHKIIEFLIPHLNHWGYYVLLLMTFDDIFPLFPSEEYFRQQYEAHTKTKKVVFELSILERAVAIRNLWI